jgi:5-(carboxyamino)imidazole ribonucleotide synthase
MVDRYDVGIVGAGQLARMMVQAAISLGLQVRLLSESPTDGAALVWPDVVVGSPNDPDAVASFAEACDVVTFDHELVPPLVLERLVAQGINVRPSPSALAFAQNKRLQRERFGQLGLPVPPFQRVQSLDNIAMMGATFGWPLAIKMAAGGYDGRGVWRIDSVASASDLFDKLAGRESELIAEAWMPIEREVAVIVARSPSGTSVVYPVVDTVQADGICREIVAPAGVSSDIASEATALALAVAESIDVTGVMALELFVSGARLYINEIATRPHNSGHYSIEGCVTSQFEQHLRAVVGLPLGSTDLTASHVVTVNVLGGPEAEDPRFALAAALEDSGVHVHLYGKAARPGRKLGHVTVLSDDLESARARAWRAAFALSGQQVESPR